MVPLYTHGGTTYGRLNLPAVWHHDLGLVAFFGLTREHFKPDGYWTSHPVIECTFLEACRDAWSHNYVMLIDGSLIWDTQRLWTPFEALMAHLRGQRPLAPDCEAYWRVAVQNSLACAVARFDVLRRGQLWVPQPHRRERWRPIPSVPWGDEDDIPF